MNGAGLLTFLALASIFLWFIIAGKGRWLPKLIAILGVLGFAAIIWYSALSFTGWPTHDGPPKLALFVSGFVVEPDDEQDGAIYLWLVSPPDDTTVYEYQSKDGEPRAYVLPYDRELHEQVQGAQAAAAQGRRVAFSAEGQPAGGGQRVGEGEQGQSGRPGQGQGSGGRPSGNTGGGNSGTNGGAPGFYVLPNSSSVPKG